MLTKNLHVVLGHEIPGEDHGNNYVARDYIGVPYGLWGRGWDRRRVVAYKLLQQKSLACQISNRILDLLMHQVIA